MRGTIIVRPVSTGDVSVALVQPEPGRELVIPGSIQLEARVDAGGIEIIHVELFNRDVALGLAPAGPYVLPVNLGEGDHSLTAVATHSDGASTASEAVQVTVFRPEPATLPSTSIVDATAFTVSWEQGAGPFLVQRSTDLTDPDWETDAAVADPTHSASLSGSSGFFRVVDAAEHEAIPFTTVLSGAAERPAPAETDATGSGLFRLEGDILTFNIWYEGLSGPATAAHIHGPASTETSAGILVNVESFAAGGFGASGAFLGSTPLSPIDLARLIDQLTYINVHTQAHPPGEIRGQILR